LGIAGPPGAPLLLGPRRRGVLNPKAARGPPPGAPRGPTKGKAFGKGPPRGNRGLGLGFWVPRGFETPNGGAPGFGVVPQGHEIRRSPFGGAGEFPNPGGNLSAPGKTPQGIPLGPGEN